MPSIQKGNAEIYFETCGEGFPILTFAPKGLFSTIDVWDMPNAPIKPVHDYRDQFQIITMDQRNAGGKSIAPLSKNDGWNEYAYDQIAILDQLGIKKCHLYGQCIGGPFILKLLELYPDRFSSAVIAQPIGRVNVPLPSRTDVFNKWANGLENHPEATSDVLDAFYQNLYGSGFVYSIDKESITKCQTPTMVFAGNDGAHPLQISREIASLLPNNEVFLKEWKEGEALRIARECVRDFFVRHTVKI